MVTVQSWSTTGVRRLDVCGQRLRVDVRRGDGTGPPLLLCNGLGATFEVLQPLVDALDSGIEVVRFDVPGVGGSPTGALPYAFPQLARLVGAMLAKLGYRGEIDVLGYSWGGALAQQLALQRGRDYRRLILISTSTGMLSVPGRPAALGSMLTPRNVRRPDQAIAVAGRLGRDRGGLDGGPGLPRPVFDDFHRGYFNQLAAIAAWTSLPFLPLITQPTLIVSGDDDPIVPIVNARIMAELIPRSTLQVFSGGHDGIITQAAEIGRRVSDFLA